MGRWLSTNWGSGGTLRQVQPSPVASVALGTSLNVSQPAASCQADASPQEGWGLGTLLPTGPRPTGSPEPPEQQPVVRGRMRAAGVSWRWRINIPGTWPRPPAHAEENITAISGGSSARAQYLDGEFGVINLALSSSLRGPRGAGMFGMGRAQEHSRSLGVCWGSSCARGRLWGPPPRPPGGQLVPRLWPLAGCQW